MSRRSATQLLAFAFAALASVPAAAQEPKPESAKPETVSRDESTPDASAVISAVAKAIGDHAALAEFEPLRFRFTVAAQGRVAAERKVLWSPKRGQARVELETKSGRVVGAFEIDGAKSVIENGGNRLSGAEAEKIAAQLKKTFRGDWNYFTLAHRLSDPSLVVTREADEVEGGKTYVRLAIEYAPSSVAFAGDRYGLLVDLETGLPHALFVKWKSMKADQAPLRFDYSDWYTFGAIKLPRSLTGNGNPQTLTFDGLETKVEATPADFLGLEP